MSELFLSSKEKETLRCKLSEMENKNGKDILIDTTDCEFSDCYRWDCPISCYCANSYK